MEVLYVWLKVPLRISNLVFIKASLKPSRLQTFDVDLQIDSVSKGILNNKHQFVWLQRHEVDFRSRGAFQYKRFHSTHLLEISVLENHIGTLEIYSEIG